MRRKTLKFIVVRLVSSTPLRLGIPCPKARTENAAVASRSAAEAGCNHLPQQAAKCYRSRLRPFAEANKKAPKPYGNGANKSRDHPSSANFQGRRACLKSALIKLFNGSYAPRSNKTPYWEIRSSRDKSGYLRARAIKTCTNRLFSANGRERYSSAVLIF